MTNYLLSSNKNINKPTQLESMLFVTRTLPLVVKLSTSFNLLLPINCNTDLTKSLGKKFSLPLRSKLVSTIHLRSSEMEGSALRIRGSISKQRYAGSNGPKESIHTWDWFEEALQGSFQPFTSWGISFQRISGIHRKGENRWDLRRFWTKISMRPNRWKFGKFST